MSKEDQGNLSAELARAVLEAGFKGGIITATNQFEKTIKDFVMKIERAHQEAGKDNGHVFCRPLTSNLQPSNS